MSKTKIFKYLALALAIAAILPGSRPTPQHTGSGGWETGGGDLYALKYVKIGRALGKEMAKGRTECAPLLKWIDPVRFLQTVDETHVSSIDGTAGNIARSIQFDRRRWYNTSQDRKVLQVFTEYATLATGKAISLSSEDIQSCLSQSHLSKIFSENDEIADDSMVTFLTEFRQSNLKLRQLVEKHAVELKKWSISPKKLLEVAERAGRTSTLSSSGSSKAQSKGKCVTPLARRDFILETTSVPIRFDLDEIKDGKNSKTCQALYLLIDEPQWARASSAQRVELLFHEYLGLTDVDDSKYQYSSRLWEILPSRFYACL